MQLSLVLISFVLSAIAQAARHDGTNLRRHVGFVKRASTTSDSSTTSDVATSSTSASSTLSTSITTSAVSTSSSPSTSDSSTTTSTSTSTISSSSTSSTASSTATSKAFPFSPGFDIQKVAEVAKALPSHSWEYGAAVEALLELYNPEYSVFGKKPFPVPSLNPANVESLSYAASKIVIGTGKDGLSDGAGAVGDPASLLVAAIMLGKTNATYMDASKGEIDYMTKEAPRFFNGAISQRADVPELWADFMYMAPPGMAYYAVETNDFDLLNETVFQCSYYRQVLQANLTYDIPYKGVWEHIIGPQSQDVGLWSTGNGWAAAGMVRVLATVQKAPLPGYREAWRNKACELLTKWIKEILDGAMGAPKDQLMLRNYLNDTSGDGHGYGELSGTTLLAAVAYRMAVLNPGAIGTKYIAWAEGVRRLLGGVDLDGNPHIQDGVATPTVNPLNWQSTKPFTQGSPEGNNFVVLMYTAWRDCVLARVCRGAYL